MNDLLKLAVKLFIVVSCFSFTSRAERSDQAIENEINYLRRQLIQFQIADHKANIRGLTQKHPKRMHYQQRIQRLKEIPGIRDESYWNQLLKKKESLKQKQATLSESGLHNRHPKMTQVTDELSAINDLLKQKIGSS